MEIIRLHVERVGIELRIRLLREALLEAARGKGMKGDVSVNRADEALAAAFARLDAFPLDVAFCTICGSVFHVADEHFVSEVDS